MALSGTINGLVTLNSSAYNFYLTWEATQSVAGNYSDVTLRAYWSRNAGYYNEFDTSGTRNASVTIGDNTYSWSQRFDLMPFSPNPYLIKEYSARIYHDADGTKSVYIGARANGNAATYGPSNSVASSGDCVAGATVTLDTIPRASALSLNKTSLTAGESITATVTPASGSFSHAVTWSCGSYSSSATLPAGTTSHALTVPASWAGAFPNANSGTLTCSVQTKSGSTNIGSPVTKTATLNVPSYTPSATLTESGNNLLDGEYIKGKSTVGCSVSASSSYGATISSISTSAAGKTYSGASFTTSVLSSAGSVTITSTVTDSRGKTNTDSKTITVRDYASPYISTLTAVRCLSDGTPDDEGTYAKVTFVGGCSSVNNKNARVYKVNGDDIENNAYTINRDNIIISGISTEETHIITASIQDSYNTVSKSVTVPTVAVTMDFHSSGKGIALGKVAEEEGLLDVAWDVKGKSFTTTDKPSIPDGNIVTMDSNGKIGDSGRSTSYLSSLLTKNAHYYRDGMTAWARIVTFTASSSYSGAGLEVKGFSNSAGLSGRGDWILNIHGDSFAQSNYIRCELVYAGNGINPGMFDLRHMGSGSYILYFYAPQYTSYHIIATNAYNGAISAFDVSGATQTPSGGTSIPCVGAGIIASGSYNQGGWNTPTRGAVTQITDNSSSQHSVVVGLDPNGSRRYGIDFLDSTSPALRLYAGSNWLELNSSGIGSNNPSGTLSRLGAQGALEGSAASNNGYFRIPSMRLQICYKWITWTGSIASAWGSLYQSSNISLGDWPASFNTVPRVALSAYCSSSPAYISFVANGETNPTASSAGSAILLRGTSTTSRTWEISAYGIGSY